MKKEKFDKKTYIAPLCSIIIANVRSGILVGSGPGVKWNNITTEPPKEEQDEQIFFEPYQP